MSMDCNTIKKEIDTIVKTKIDFSHVLNFITGFYCDEAQFLKFIVEKPNYKYQQYLNLAELGPLKDAEAGRKRQYINNVRAQYEKNIINERKNITERLEQRRQPPKKVSASPPPSKLPDVPSAAPSSQSSATVVKMVDLTENKVETSANSAVAPVQDPHQIDIM